ncbi:MAG: hypothetical protein QRY74_04475 [Chlamydia sp.]
MNTYHISQKQPATQPTETQPTETQPTETQPTETQPTDKPYIENEKNRPQISETPLFPIAQEPNEQTDIADKKDKEVQDQTSETLTSSVLPEQIEPSKSAIKKPINFKENWEKFHKDNGINEQINKKINTESDEWKTRKEKIVISHLPTDIQNPNNKKNKNRKANLHEKIGKIIDTINKAIIENCKRKPKATNAKNVRSLILPVIEQDKDYRELLTEVVNALKEARCIFQVNCDKKEEIRIWA